MSPYRILRGEIGYFHRQHGLTGRESFTISAASDGSRTARAYPRIRRPPCSRRIR